METGREGEKGRRGAETGGQGEVETGGWARGREEEGFWRLSPFCAVFCSGCCIKSG